MSLSGGNASSTIDGMEKKETREARRLVVAVIPTDTSPGRAELRGVSDAAARLGWTLEVIDRALVGEDLRPFLTVLSKADGVIVRMNGALRDGTLFGLGVPLVGIDTTPPVSRALWTSINLVERKVGEIAADELIATGRRCLAFVPMLRRYRWTDERGKAFLARARASGCDARLYCPQTEWNWAKEREALARWLSELPRPFGVFAGNDLLARLVLGACQDVGLSVPDAAAVLGADDDETICLASSPAISSVRIDFEGAGRRAVEIMASLFGRQRPATTQLVRFEPLGVSRRASTRSADGGVDPRVMSGLDFIAMHASDPTLSVGDVARAMFVCRRQADRLFRATGKSIREHIEDARLRRVQSLLRSSGKTAAALAAECGFASATYLSRVFRRKIGSTIRVWRAFHATTLVADDTATHAWTSPAGGTVRQRLAPPS